MARVVCFAHCYRRARSPNYVEVLNYNTGFSEIVRYNPDTMGWENCDCSAKKGHLHLKQLMFYVIEKCKDVWLD